MTTFVTRARLLRAALRTGDGRQTPRIITGFEARDLTLQAVLEPRGWRRLATVRCDPLPLDVTVHKGHMTVHQLDATVHGFDADDLARCVSAGYSLKTSTPHRRKSASSFMRGSPMIAVSSAVSGSASMRTKRATPRRSSL